MWVHIFIIFLLIGNTYTGLDFLCSARNLFITISVPFYLAHTHIKIQTLKNLTNN
jgi:hypothetical protein